MKNYSKAYLKIQKEQEAYVEKIKSLIFNLLELNGASQNDGGTFPSTNPIVYPRFGYEFDCRTYGTGYNFTVSVIKNYVKATGTIPGEPPAKMVTKKWYNLEKLEKEFIQVFGRCFYKKQSFQEILDNKLSVPISE